MESLQGARLRILAFILPFILIGSLQAQSGKGVFDVMSELSGTHLNAYVPEDSTLTTTLTADTWEFLGAGSTNKFVNVYGTDDFGFTGDTLQYVGDVPILLFINYGGSSSSNQPLTTINYAIQVDGTLQTQSVAGTLCKTAGELYSNASGPSFIYVPANEKIKIMIKADKGCTVTTHSFPIVAFKIQ